MGWLSGGSLFGINKGLFELEVGSWEWRYKSVPDLIILEIP